jgi:tetratricopeptide (TPR) repeat protein
MWKIVIAALILSAPSAARTENSPPADRIEEALSVPFWEDTDDWVDLRGTGIRLLIPKGAERGAFWRILRAANQGGLSLRYRFDASAGRLNAERGRVEYPLCSIIAANGARFGDETRNCPLRPAAGTRGERLLAAGLAAVSPDPERARRSLSEALAARPALPRRGEGLARAARARTAEILAEALDPGEALDVLMAEALVDYRRLAVLAPDSLAPQLSLANVLRDLGGYAEAAAIYEDIGRRWPDESFELAMSTSVLARQQGEYERALGLLDAYARVGEPVSLGMRFYYHRGWTLGLLGRSEEAIADLDRGLAAQPDYSSAFMLRACMNARLGRFDEALSDQERALELHAGSPPNATTTGMIEESRAAAAGLRAAIAAARTEPSPIGCGGWDRWGRPRARSPLLNGALR